MSRRVKRCFEVGLITVCCAFATISATYAQTSQSANYQLDESTVGAGGLIQSSSTNYQASSAASDLAVGHAESANYQLETGSQTTNDPALSFSIDDVSPDLGNFTPTASSTTTAKFSVSNYTSYGYVVQIVGTAPTYGSHTIAPLTTTSSSEVGTDQFGINLVANTSPASVGANPDNGDFGFGTIDPNYNVANQFRFVSGEIIASAPKSSGKTTYTISYLANVDNLNPGGVYKSQQTLVITGTY